MLKNKAVALGLLLFAVFLLTGSGHTYSPDEESIVYIEQSFLTHGDFSIPDPQRYPVVGGHRGVGGQYYSGNGVFSSLVALPLYTVGQQIAGAFDPTYREMILRLFVVLLFNSLISALTGILFYSWLRRLGASPRVSAALVLVYAFATLTWVYARTFYSEPLQTLCFVLAGYALCRFHDTRKWSWIAVAGAATGLSTLIKLQGLLVLPALGIYYLALELPALVREWRVTRRIPSRVWASFILPGLVFAGVLAVGIALTLYLNWLRFRDPFDTGYGDISQSSPILTGIYGLLLSSGKSVFLYAPPALLFFFAFPGFLKRHMAAALYCLVLIATFVLFNARIQFWAGDGAWGPRYMVSLVPFFLLPLGPVAGRWWRSPLSRAALVFLVGAGLFVNLLGVAINFDTYIQMQPVEDLRHFYPPASPLLAQWSLLSDRASAWWTSVATSHDALVPVRGFLGTAQEDLFPRYLAQRATVLVKSDGNQSATLALTAFDYRPDTKPRRELAFLSGGVQLQAQRLPSDDKGVLNYRVQIPAALARWASIDIVTLGSDPVGKSPMGDELGVHLQSLEATSGDNNLEIGRYVAIPPLPAADPRVAWGWFFAPVYPHFDFYQWYLYFSGLDDLRVVTIIVIISLFGLACLVTSAATVVRLLTRPA